MLTQNQQQQKNLGDFILQKVQRKNKLSYQMSANLKRRCWSKIECSSSNTLLLLINNQLMSVCFHFSPVSCLLTLSRSHLPKWCLCQSFTAFYFFNHYRNFCH